MPINNDYTPIDNAVMYIRGDIELDANDINDIGLVIKMMARQCIVYRDKIEANLQPHMILGQLENRQLAEKLDEKIKYAMDLIKGMHDRYESIQGASSTEVSTTTDGASTGRNTESDPVDAIDGDEAIGFDGGTVSKVID